MNKHNKTEIELKTQNKQVVARGEGGEGRKETCEGRFRGTNFQLQNK